jgi:predicted nucleic acid-binding protein
VRTPLKRSSAYRLQVAEPGGPYPQRPPLVIDASVIAAALFGESNGGEAQALLHGRALHAPHLLDLEIASVALKKLSREKLPREALAAALEAYARLPIARHEVDAGAILGLAETHGLTAYDAAYLHVAEQLTAPLATLDGRLAAAARIHLASPREVHETE